ncbi:9156_t:CDS:1, partial [Gigaspora rosea]
IFLSVDALPYDKPKVYTIPLKPKSITRRRLSKRAMRSMPLRGHSRDYVYYGQVTFGTGKQQNFDIQFATGIGDFYVLSEYCVSPACKGKPKYNEQIDSSFVPSFGKNFSIKYPEYTENSGYSGKTTIEIAGLKVKAQEVGLIKNVTEPEDYASGWRHPFSGVMGMGFSELSINNQTTPITNLINNHQLDKPEFSFLLGREADKLPSELTIGGSNPKKYHANTLTFTNVVDDNKGEWKIPIDNVVINGEKLNLKNRTAIIDTGTALIVMPYDDAKEFYSKIPNARDNGAGYYTLRCEYQYEVGLEFNGKTWYIDPKDFLYIRVGNEYCIGAVSYDN